MSERKILARSIPLRVRIRPVQEHSPTERGQVDLPQDRISNEKNMGVQYSPPDEKEKRSRQIKELVRLCDLLRADLGLDDVLEQVAASIADCTDYRALCINLIDEKQSMLVPAAFAGLSPEEQQMLRSGPFSINVLFDVMQPEFQISQSYYIPHNRADVFGETTTVYPTKSPLDGYEPGQWHHQDNLIVPLYSPSEKKLLGCLSLDDPVDGKAPTLSSIEIVELFANKASIAIDNARLFQEREAERVALEEGIAALREDLEKMAQGDLRGQVRSTHPKLQPAAEAINAMVGQLSMLLKDMQEVAQAVDDHMQNMQQNSNLLAKDTDQQEVQVHQISQTIGQFARMMNSISERAAHLSKTAVEAVDVTIEAQGTVDRAVEGMGAVREATMHSARTMKTLSESGQEVNETISAMNDLTMRMHLLALNAAIEATRAGEAGQGFSIIAKEIRTLATQSTDAARKVGTYIRNIQQETTAVSQSVEQSTQQVIMQTELVTQTGVALDAISIVTEQLTNLIQGICTIAESQTQGSQLVVSSVDEILRMTGDVTRHMQEMQQSTNRLVELTDSLRARMSRMQIR